MQTGFKVFVLFLVLVGSIVSALGAQPLPANLPPACGSTGEAEAPNISQDCFNYRDSSIQHPAPYEAYCAGTGPGCTECISYPGGGNVQTCYRVEGGQFVICISNQSLPWTQL